MNVGIIAGCMSAMPSFFNRSKFFHLSTYRSLQSRFLSGHRRNKTRSNLSCGLKKLGSSDSFDKEGMHAKTATYYKLKNVAKVEGGVSERTDDENSESVGIIKRDEYDLS